MKFAEDVKKSVKYLLNLPPSGDVLCQDCIWDFLKEGEELGGKK